MSPVRASRWLGGRLGARLALVAAGVGLGLVIAAPAPAHAHSQLISSSPAKDSTVRQQIPAIVLKFNEPVRGRFSTVVVSGPDEASYSRGTLRVVDATVTQDVYPLRSGHYRVAWRIVSADGHPVSDEFSFEVSLPPGLEPTAGPPSPTAPGSTRPAGAPAPAGLGTRSWDWWWPLIVAAIAVSGGLLWLRLSRRGGPNGRA